LKIKFGKYKVYMRKFVEVKVLEFGNKKNWWVLSKRRRRIGFLLNHKRKRKKWKNKIEMKQKKIYKRKEIFKVDKTRIERGREWKGCYFKMTTI